MTTIFEDLSNVNRLVHEPARLSILTALSVCKQADFVYLQRLTGLSVGNLSSHLGKLEEARLVAQEKKFVNRRPNTQIRITDLGRATITAHWKQLEHMHQAARDWDPDQDDTQRPTGSSPGDPGL